MNSAILIFYLS